MRFAAAIAVLLLCATGCQQQQISLRSWQDSVENYVWDQANGDPSALRDLPTPGPWKGFSIIGENDAAAATDINGVLLGHRAVGSKTYFIYLVGIVQQQKLQDIRLAALWASPGDFQWHMAEKNDDPVRTYRDFKDAQWRNLFPHRSNGPWSYTGFPSEGDVFRISVAGGRVTATHEQSGAVWTLELPQEGPATAPSVAGSN